MSVNIYTTTEYTKAPGQGGWSITLVSVAAESSAQAEALYVSDVRSMYGGVALDASCRPIIHAYIMTDMIEEVPGNHAVRRHGYVAETNVSDVDKQRWAAWAVQRHLCEPDEEQQPAFWRKINDFTFGA